MPALCWLCSVPWAAGTVSWALGEDWEPWGIPIPPPHPGLSPTSSPELRHTRLRHTGVAASSPTFFFFSSSLLFLGVGGGRGREDQPVNVDVG